MGSSGTGKFSDYSKSTQANTSGGNGGSSGEDPCAAEVDAVLEEVERSQYYKLHNSLPSVGIHVGVMLKERLAVEVNGELIGYLPTEYNYLASCIKSGSTYSGVITSVANHPVFRIQVHIART